MQYKSDIIKALKEMENRENDVTISFGITNSGVWLVLKF